MRLSPRLVRREETQCNIWVQHFTVVLPYYAFKMYWGAFSGWGAPPYKQRGALSILGLWIVIECQLQTQRVTDRAFACLLAIVEVNAPCLISKVAVNRVFFRPDVHTGQSVDSFPSHSPLGSVPIREDVEHSIYENGRDENRRYSSREPEQVTCATLTLCKTAPSANRWGSWAVGHSLNKEGRRSSPPYPLL